MTRKRATAKIVRQTYNQSPPHPVPTPRGVLQELFDLLEEYGPVWYSEELRDRAKTALSFKDK